MNGQPRELHVLDFVKERATDIAHLLAVVDNEKLPFGEVTHGKRTCLQHLPRHMRRRAMSHNIQRFPQSQRHFARTAVTDKPSKPPCRFRRRKATNLLQAYANRARKVCWLGTHIWHARRFHMVSRWGHRLAERSCARAFRATYRDTLCGVRSVLLCGLARLCSARVGRTFAYAAAFDGSEECSIVLYEADRYPLGCIGPVNYSWVDAPADQAAKGPCNTSALCVWLHPAHKHLVIQQLCNVFTLCKESDKENVYKGQETLVQLTLIQNELTRFTLTGRLSASVLWSVLQPVNEQSTVLQATVHSRNWWAQHSTLNDLLAHNTAVYTRPCSDMRHGQVTGGVHAMVITLCVSDPRLQARAGKHKPKPLVHVTHDHDQATPNQYSYKSALWQSSVRKQLNEHKLTDQQLQTYSKQLAQSECDTVIPVILIFRNHTNNGMGSGVDVIMPSAYSLSLWVALQYSTARATALNDHRHFALECARPYFPDDWPDSVAGTQATNQMAVDLRAKWNARPPKCRADHNRLAVKWPFECNWLQLLHDTNSTSPCTTTDSDSGTMYVLRDRAVLALISKCTVRTSTSPMQTPVVDPNALVLVSLTCTEKGTIKHLAMIYAADTDIHNQPLACCHDGPMSTQPVCESSLIGSVSVAEKAVVLGHLFPDQAQARLKHATNKKHKKRLDRKKARIEEIDDKKVADDGKLVIGCVIRGDYSFLRARPFALGYCSARMVIGLSSSQVLYRNTNSTHYHQAKLQVITQTY